MEATELILEPMTPNKTIDWRQFTQATNTAPNKKRLKKKKPVPDDKVETTIISPVRNQMNKGVCASSYAFVVNSALEAAYR